MAPYHKLCYKFRNTLSVFDYCCPLNCEKFVEVNPKLHHRYGHICSGTCACAITSGQIANFEYYVFKNSIDGKYYCWDDFDQSNVSIEFFWEKNSTSIRNFLFKISKLTKGGGNNFPSSSPIQPLDRVITKTTKITKTVRTETPLPG